MALVRIKDFMTAKDRLENWMKMKRVFSSSEVIAIGSRMFSNRADRDKRQLVEDGKIRKLKRSEHVMNGYKADTREDVYAWVESVPDGCMI